MSENKINDFKGIYPALVTPFTPDDRLNEDALRKLVRMNIEKGVQGFYVCGSTGEAFLMTQEERQRVLEVVVDEVQGRCRIIAHIGCIGTSQALTLGIHAKKLGIDAVSAIPPFYYKYGFDEIREHYFTIANALKIPMIVYNYPANSGVELKEENIKELRKNKYIMGIKHTSMNLYQISRLKAQDNDLLIFNGHDEVYLGGLVMGCDGAIGSTYNFMAEKFIGIESYFREGKISEATMLQKEANEIIAVLIRTGVFQGIKYILSKMGIDCGECRLPFRKLNQQDMQDIDRVM